MIDLNNFINKFIVFEGGDSTGKSSVAKLLVDYFNENGIEAILTFQPGDSESGPLAPFYRSLCKDKRLGLSAEANMFAFLLDRAENVNKVIRPALKAGKTVVIDRYTFSTVAYQLYGKELIKEITESCGQEVAIALLKWFKNPYPDVTPDVIYYFPEKVGSRESNDNDIFETSKNGFMKRVREAYELMVKDEYSNLNWKIVKPGSSAKETMTNLLNMN